MYSIGFLIIYLKKIEVSKYAKAYIKNRTLKYNAKFHRKQNVVVTMDIKDFSHLYEFLTYIIFLRELVI